MKLGDAVISAVLLAEVMPRTEWLSAAELARAERYATEELRQRFLARRTALRSFVASLAGLAADSLVPDYSCPDHGRGVDHGRPGFVLGSGEPIPWALSSSDSGPWAVFAAHPGISTRLGVDLERIDRVSFAGFDDGVLSAAERLALDALPVAERDGFRARCWARKEALVKAWGSGLRVRPTGIDSTNSGLVDLEPRSLGLPEEYAVALAVLR
nr:4'-phosphopantetheinyl transferase superfamily protein [Psychromicrobium silvestre]